LEQSDKKNDGSNAVRPTCAPNRVPQEHEFSTTIKNSQAVLEQSDKKNDGSNAVRPACAPNRVPQEHEFSATIKMLKRFGAKRQKNEAEASAPPHLAAF
jgi:hypothetical protein